MKMKILKYFNLIFVLFYLLIIFGYYGASTNTIMNLAEEITGYTYYGDITPVKHSVPSGLSHVNFTIRTAKNRKECPNYTANILIQHGGLPLVHQTDFSFPSDFVTSLPTFMLDMNPDTQVSFSVIRPLPGNWFIIAYNDHIPTEIKQKGFDSVDKCHYSLMSSISLGETTSTTIITYNTNQTTQVNASGKMFSFRIPRSTFSYDVMISSCLPEPCNITITYLPSQLTSIQIGYCQDQQINCSMQITSPTLDDIQLIEIRYIGGLKAQQIRFNVTVQQCAEWSSSSKSFCKTFPLLDKIQTPQTFHLYYGYLYGNTISFSKVNLTKAPVIIIPFQIEDPGDIGGTLKWRLQILNFTYGMSVYMKLCGGLIFGRLPPFNETSDICDSLPNVVNRAVTGVNFSRIIQYVPYPRAGTWHIIVQVRCYKQELDQTAVCPPNITAEMSLEIQQCLENSCSGKGRCQLIGQGSQNVILAACKCDADYQGYACTDSTRAQSVVVQLAAAFLLTLSNLFFLPAIIIAAKRRFLVEAFVYTYTMFFSTFYHACDGDRLGLYRLCIISFDVLQAADFFGSYCSIWYTLIAMAQIRFIWLRNILQAFGPFGILVGVVYDRRSVCLIAVPLLGGLFTIAVSWGIKMYKMKKLYPSWRRYVFFFLPGCVLAAAGGTVFIFLETQENYKYLHSFWHVCVALCICFLLPPHPAKSINQDLPFQHPVTELMQQIHCKKHWIVLVCNFIV